MRKIIIAIVIVLFLFNLLTGQTNKQFSSTPDSSTIRQIKITVLYNNTAKNTSFTPNNGFSCFVEGLDKTILFDSGAKSDIDSYFKTANLVLPNGPINNILWVIWGFIIAVMIFIISKKIQSIANNIYCVDSSVCYALDCFMEFCRTAGKYLIAGCSINFYKRICWCFNMRQIY